MSRDTVVEDKRVRREQLLDRQEASLSASERALDARWAAQRKRVAVLHELADYVRDREETLRSRASRLGLTVSEVESLLPEPEAEGPAPRGPGLAQFSPHRPAERVTRGAWPHCMAKRGAWPRGKIHGPKYPLPVRRLRFQPKNSQIMSARFAHGPLRAHWPQSFEIFTVPVLFTQVWGLQTPQKNTAESLLQS